MDFTAEQAAAFKPLDARILVRRIEDPEFHRGTIIVPDVAIGPSTLCRVVAVGPGRWRGHKRIPCDVVPGDVVRIGPYTDCEDKFGNYVLIQEDDIRLKWDHAQDA